MKKSYLVLFFLFLLKTNSFAQLPTVGDCMGAIPICSTFYDEPDPYIWTGTGNYPNEIYRAKPCMMNELNGMWYTFTSLSSGLLRFTITPHDSLTDYDWNVFDVTYGSCNDLANRSEQFLISSNTYGATNTTLQQALTGANSKISKGSGNCNGPGVSNGPAWNDDIPVFKDHIYIIYISNWSGSKYGYSIDFKESTADIWDRRPPTFNALLDDAICGQNTLKVLFSENILCDKVAANFFKISDSFTEYLVDSVTNVTCKNGGTYSRDYTLHFKEPLAPGNYTITYNDTLCDICGNKTFTDSLKFEIDSLKIENIDIQNITCNSFSDGSISITTNTPKNSTFYSINSVDYEINKNKFTNLTAQNYQVSIKNKFGCISDTFNFQLTQPDSIKITVAKTDIFPCFNDNNGSVEISVTGGTSPFKFAFGSETNFSDNFIFSNLSAKTYKIIAKDKNNCLNNQFVTIAQPEEVVVSLIKIEQVACFGDSTGSIQIQVKPENATINWSNGESNLLIDSLKSGNYLVEVFDANGCKKNASFLLTQPSVLSLEKTSKNVLCYGEATGFASVLAKGGTPQYSYKWSNGSTSYKVENLMSGKYKITVADANNCSLSDSLVIEQAPKLLLGLVATSASSNIVNDGVIYVDIQGGTPSYLIEILAQNIPPPYNLNALFSDFYTITVTDQNNCQISDTITLTAYINNSIIEVPNVFTPNSDGANDFFGAKAYGLKSFSCIIVNRWGRKVYQWNNPYETWDGTINSNEASDGVYFYIINAVGMDNKNYNLKGSFYLFR